MSPMRIGALVPIRLASERLPGKAILPLGGRPVVLHLLDRLFASRHLAPDRVVVCTTKDSSDDALVPVVEASGARIFRGSRDDIIDRLHQAGQEYRFDAVLEVDGDDPFFDVAYADRCVDRLAAEPAVDVVLSEGLPFGMGAKAIRTGALQRVWERHRTERNDTGFMYYFTKTGLCVCEQISADDPKHRHAQARVTLDYPEDLAFFEALWRELSPQNRIFGVGEVVALLRRRPELVAINAGRSAEYWNRTRERLELEYEVEGRLYRVEG